MTHENCTLMLKLKFILNKLQLREIKIFKFFTRQRSSTVFLKKNQKLFYAPSTLSKFAGGELPEIYSTIIDNFTCTSLVIKKN